MDNTNYIQEVRDIFVDYYGEDKIDLVEVIGQGYNIIVYFPVVTVTNEHNKSIVIYDLFAKVKIKPDGWHINGKFQLLRSTYTKPQAVVGYTHSHIPDWTSLGNWGDPCLGRGPLNNTIDTLSRDAFEFEEMKSFWELFCRELDDYTQVESIAGIPYIRMSHVGADEARNMNRNFLDDNYTPESKLKFIAKAILRSGKLKLSYSKKQFQLGMSDTDFALLATRIAYDVWLKMGRSIGHFVNEFDCEEYILCQGRLCGIANNNRRPHYNQSELGREVITFKGRVFKLRVFDEVDLNNPDSNHVLVMSKENLNSLKCLILYLINATYGRAEITGDAVFL